MIQNYENAKLAVWSDFNWAIGIIFARRNSLKNRTAAYDLVQAPQYASEETIARVREDILRNWYFTKEFCWQVIYGLLRI